MALLSLIAAAVLGGCGDESTTAAGPDASPDPGGTLTIAVAGRIATLDPLRASGRAERLASRQVYEPLRASQRGPFGGARRRPGMVVAFRANPDATAWMATLRRGISFQDGAALDADAVLANANRWIGSAAGDELVPELVAADSPRPGHVRFLLARPDRRFPARLGDPRLGIVAPSALAGQGDGRVQLGASGTGPFELREHDGGGILLARNADWWGTGLGLGPGVDQIELASDPVPSHRLDALLDGAVDVAVGLGRNGAKRISSAPLLTMVHGAAGTFGMERSVRGLDSAAASQSLADVWLTDLR